MINTYRIALVITALIASFSINAAGTKTQEIKAPAAVSPVAFNEVWGYLMRDEEHEYSGAEPITDIGYFSMWINVKGKLCDRPAYPKLKNGKIKPRVHMVVSELTSVALTHFILRPDLPMRKILIRDIVDAGKVFDGIQIDFEQVAADDRANFLSFLKEIREKLPKEKVFSIALPARRSYVNDAYDYEEISKIADRLIIMAYDEHWSTSNPGPVASIAWCNDIMKYSKTKIPNEKIVMGLPLYGRSWGSKKHSYSLRYFQTMNILSKRKINYKVDPFKGPYVEYHERSTVKIYFDDTNSLISKLSMYNTNSVSAVAFWRLGQGPADLWIKLSVIEKVSDAGKTAENFTPEAKIAENDTKTKRTDADMTNENAVKTEPVDKKLN